MTIYLASYLPLSVILLCQDLNLDAVSGPLCSPWRGGAHACSLPLQHPILALGLVCLCAACLAVSILALSLASPKQRISITEVKPVPADLMNYVLPYVVAFMVLDYKDHGKLLGFLVFFLWIFVITYRSGQIILNPVLTVFGWRLFEATYRFEGGTGSEHSGVVLSKLSLETGATYRQSAIQDVLIIKSQ
jgi:hypothetical protein